jgi:hypothetical protein
VSASGSGPARQVVDSDAIPVDMALLVPPALRKCPAQ